MLELFEICPESIIDKIIFILQGSKSFGNVLFNDSYFSMHSSITHTVCHTCVQSLLGNFHTARKENLRSIYSD